MKELYAEELRGTLSCWLDARIADATIAGGEILVMQRGERLCHLVRGVADAKSGQVLEPNAMFRLASMTKPVTGLAALVAVRKGYFSLHDEVRRHLPQFGERDVAVIRDGRVVRDHKARSELKIYQLLCHTSGILAETEVGTRLMAAAPRSAFDSIAGMLDYAASQPLAFDPGERTAYTGYASFDAVAHIIEEKSSLAYSEFLQREIFNPLDIHDIAFHLTPEQRGRLVAMHDRTVSGRLAVVEMPEGSVFEGFGPDYECAGAGLAGCMEDFAKIAQMMCDGGSLGGVEIVDAGLFRELARPRVPDGVPGRAPNDSWGLGVRVKVHADWLPEGAFGWSGAYGTHFWVDPANRIVAILLRNMRWYDTHGAGRMGVEFEQNVMCCAR